MKGVFEKGLVIWLFRFDGQDFAFRENMDFETSFSRLNGLALAEGSESHFCVVNDGGELRNQ